MDLDRKLQKKVYAEYPHLRAPKIKPTFEEFCYPRKFKLQLQQEWAGEYMRPGNIGKYNDTLLVFHKIGAGKTCLAIQISEKWTSRGKPLIIMPASLIPGFRNELRSQCVSHNKYLTQNERLLLAELDPLSREYRDIIQSSNDRIDQYYNIVSYNKLVERGGKVKGKTSIVIVDEVQNISNIAGVFFRTIYQFIMTHNDIPAIILSGTPIFDSPRELTGLAKLLRIDVDKYKNEPIPIDDIYHLFAGRVSYFAGAPAYTFPRVEIKVNKLPMSKFQQRWYRSEVEAEMKRTGGVKLTQISNDFYSKSRQRSNIVFPNGLRGQSGLDALTPSMIKSNLATYSCKFDKLVKRLSKKELAFVYTGFTETGGIETLKKIMSARGWSDYAVSGVGPRRYAIWSGDETLLAKDRLRSVFNSRENDDGKLIQVIIGSPSIKEGVSLLRVRTAHVLEAHWNHSRLEQIYGRIVRYCSHKTLKKAERSVIIYIYAAVDENFTVNDVSPLSSIDLYMLKIADEKRDTSEPYIDALKDVSVDKLLNKNT